MSFIFFFFDKFSESFDSLLGSENYVIVLFVFSFFYLFVFEDFVYFGYVLVVELVFKYRDEFGIIFGVIVVRG